MKKIGAIKVEIAFYLCTILLSAYISGATSMFDIMNKESDIIVLNYYIIFAYTLLSIGRIYYLISNNLKEKDS